MGSSNRTLKRLELMVRSGQADSVRVELSQTNWSELPRLHKAHLASLARRVGFPELSLRALRPIVRPKIPLRQPASDKEQAEYAAALSRLGAIHEALEILQGLERSHDSLLYTGFAHIRHWDYAKAVPAFEAYLKLPQVGDYQTAIAKLNLAAAYGFLRRHDDEEKIVSELLRVTEDNQWIRLKKNTLELSAQAALFAKDWRRASALIQEATSLASSSGDDELQVKKWHLIIDLSKLGPTPEIQDRIHKLRDEADTKGRWEVARDLDYHLASATDNLELLKRVYFGTPHKSYRRRIENESGFKMPKSHLWEITGKASERCLSLSTGEEKFVDSDGAHSVVKPGQVLHRLLVALASDFYSPQSQGSLFSQVYPGEYFDIDHSAERLRAAVRRLRDLFRNYNIPLTVHVSRSSMQLRAKAPYALEIPKTWKCEIETPYRESLLEHIKSEWPYQSFSSSQVSQLTNLSRTRTRDLLNWAVKNKKLYCSGQARATRYRFSK